MSDLLVVGSAGFVGSNLTNYLIQHYPKYSVASMDSLEGKTLSRLQPAIQSRNRHQFYLADVRDHSTVKKVLAIEKPKTLLYTAFTPSQSTMANLGNLLQVIESAIGEGLKQVLIAEPAMANLPAVDYWSILETSATCILKSMPWGNALSWVWTKVHGLFGPRQLPAHTLRALLLHKTDPVVSEDDRRFDWVYIKDYFQSTMQLLENTPASGVYNFYSGNQASPKELDLYLKDLIQHGQRRALSLTSAVGRNPVVAPVDGLAVAANNLIHCPASQTLEAALEHTACWYSANTWVWGNQ